MHQIKEHMDIVGADGKKVGKVDRVEGKRIKLTKMSSLGRRAIPTDEALIRS